MMSIIELDSKQNAKLVDMDIIIRYRENKAKIQERIECFNQKFLNALRSFKQKNDDFDYAVYEFSVAELSDNVDNNMIIGDDKKLRQVMASIAMSDILLDEAIEQDDVECLGVALSGLIFDLDNLKIFNK